MEINSNSKTFYKPIPWQACRRLSIELSGEEKTNQLRANGFSWGQVYEEAQLIHAELTDDEETEPVVFYKPLNWRECRQLSYDLIGKEETEKLRADGDSWEDIYEEATLIYIKRLQDKPIRAPTPIPPEQLIMES